ncbi:uncharacterized protein LOC142564906 [Dermacentor variabilis]|uniref:uncharacterized protein LOC142564906 n=1 Tax=Dermacentor variabilis TaxID=34621 RepID=UPI003F5C1075
MQSPSKGYIFLTIVCTVTHYIVHAGASCAAGRAPVGPRLFQAKALFGDTVRRCKGEILASLKIVPPHLLRKVLSTACCMYDECKEMYQDSEFEPVIDCCITAIRNKSAPLYTKMKLPDTYQQVGVNTLMCMVKVAQERRASLQGFDDAFTIMRNVALTYGWN